MYLESLEGDIPELMKQKSQKIVPVRLEAVGGQQERLLPVPWSHDFARAYDVFKDWWQSPARSKAIFFEDECLFAAASRAILELSISVPDELGIISSRSINRPLQFPVPINSIFLDLQKMQQMAWNTLLNLIDGKEIEQRIQYISPELIEGKSL
jgi:DNA-binding LacI/PurR family transcriptional regulator